MHARELALFDDIASALNHQEIDRALDDVLAVVVRQLELAAGWIWLLDDGSPDRFYLAAAQELPPYLRSPVEMTGERCWCMESFVDGDFEYTNVDIVSCSRLRKGERERGESATAGLKSHASVALRFGTHRLGILNVCPVPGTCLDEAQLRILAAVGAQIGLAVERARLAERDADAARTQERARLARDIHDTLAQDLVAIGLQLEVARRGLEPSQSGARSAIDTALATARASLERARSSVLSLRPERLEGKSLELALGELARRFTSETGIPVALQFRGRARLDGETEREAFAIASEALRNIGRHANAAHVVVGLSHENGTTHLTIRDDGSGFATREIPVGRFGLIGMQERARAIEGSLRVESSAAGGTLVELILPNA